MWAFADIGHSFEIAPVDCFDGGKASTGDGLGQTQHRSSLKWASLGCTVDSSFPGLTPIHVTSAGLNEVSPSHFPTVGFPTPLASALVIDPCV